MIIRYIFLATVGFVLAACSPNPASAEGLTGEQFLKWERDGQEFYIGVSIGMASLIALQNDKQHGKCIDDWYKTDANKPYDFILDTMRDHPEYHPRGVILGVLQKKCGKFDYSKRD